MKPRISERVTNRVEARVTVRVKVRVNAEFTFGVRLFWGSCRIIRIIWIIRIIRIIRLFGVSCRIMEVKGDQRGERVRGT